MINAGENIKITKDYADKLLQQCLIFLRYTTYLFHASVYCNTIAIISIISTSINSALKLSIHFNLRCYCECVLWKKENKPTQLKSSLQNTRFWINVHAYGLESV